MAIEIVDFPIKKWWFSIVMLVYQRVKPENTVQNTQWTNGRLPHMRSVQKSVFGLLHKIMLTNILEAITIHERVIPVSTNLSFRSPDSTSFIRIPLRLAIATATEMTASSESFTMWASQTTCLLVYNLWTHRTIDIIWYSYCPLPVLSTYNPIYRLYNPIYSQV